MPKPEAVENLEKVAKAARKMVKKVKTGVRAGGVDNDCDGRPKAGG